MDHSVQHRLPTSRPQYDPAAPVASDIPIPGTEVSTRALAGISAAEFTTRLRLSPGRPDKLLVERGFAADPLA